MPGKSPAASHPCPQAVLELIERFNLHADTYRQQSYNETQVRREFIDPLFTTLGWDVDNKAGHAEAYKDVIHEDAIKVGGSTKAPDYCFRIGGLRKFFVEAKKPSVSVNTDPEPAYQVRRYAWSNKLPLSIVTDFEEFAVYDCQIKPKPDDKASAARVLFLKYEEYPKKWHEIASIFAKESILQGSFDHYAESNKRKRGTAEVDDEFLKEIEHWRDELARNIALRNADLSVRDLNFVVGKTIDRIIFLRMCEDRGVESYAQLRTLPNAPNIYKRLVELFYRADDRYNSGLFHFQSERGRPDEPDTLTPNLKIDDKVLKDIIKNLYYPECPYEFSVMPPEILGQVYEQFLGRVITLTAGRRAKVEYKPEVKKAGGVYYTPKYIVDYIVEHTVGKLLQEAATPIKAEKLRILDPACGSGSFLLGAYQYLLDWHLRWYTENDPARWAKKKNPPIYQSGTPSQSRARKEAEGSASANYRLSISEKKRILVSNLCGVDIDLQAVEVTKLSLLLKVLEGENAETIGNTLQLFHERALPDLANNIKCGNSLIGPDFYDNQQMMLLDEEDHYRVNVFDWQAEFPVIMKAGGFDAVIGNPPYLYSAGKDYVDYFKTRYKLSEYQTDYYVYFLEKALILARAGGYASFIVPDSWLNSTRISAVRKCLLSKHRLERVAVFGYPVFKRVTLENSIAVVRISQLPTPFDIVRFTGPQSHISAGRLDPSLCLSQGIIDPRYSPDAARVIELLETGSTPLIALFDINRGIHAYRIDGYGKSRFGPGPQIKKDKETRSYNAAKAIDKTYLPEVRGKHVHRYTFAPSGDFLSYGPWLAEPREPRFFMNPKVAVRKVLGKRLHGTLFSNPVALDQSLYVFVARDGASYDLRYPLGILLSGIGAWYLTTKHAIYDTLYPWYTKAQLGQFPIRIAEAAQRNRLIELVQRMLALHKQFAAAKTSTDKTAIQRQIDATDRQIDRLVYEVYDLTDDEIRVVEEATGSVPRL